jgi:cytochrome bd-type quinol oxidase subunit 2
MLLGIALLVGGAAWLKQDFQPSKKIWAQPPLDLLGYLITHPVAILGIMSTGIYTVTGSMVLFMLREVRQTRPARQYAGMCLTLLAFAAVVLLAAWLTLGDDGPSGGYSFLLLGLLLASVIPGVVGLVHALFAWRKERQAGST